MNKLIKKLLALVFVFAIFVAWTPKSYAAERFLYTIKTGAGEDYKILADVTGENVSIVGSPYNLICEASTGNLTSGDSYYNIIAGDYESSYNNKEVDTAYSKSQINEKLKTRAKDLLKLLQFYINAQETRDAETTTVSIKFDDNTIVSGRGATYSYGKISATTYDKLISNVTTISKSNPYAIIPSVDNPIYNSEKITVGGEKLKDIYTDKMLISLYEKALQKPSWITKEKTTESQITVDGYLLQVDKSMMDTSGEIYIKVVDSMGTTEYASFLLAEKQSVGNKYKEVTYANDDTRKVKWYERGTQKGLKIGNVLGADSSKLLYYETVNGARRTLDRYSNGSKLEISDKTAFVAIRNADSRSVFVYGVRENNGVQSTTLIGTVDIDSLGTDLSVGSLSVASGDWVLDKNGTKIRIYREGDEDPDNNCFYADLSGMYVCHTKQGTYFDIALPVIKGVNGTFDEKFNNTPGSYIAFISTNKSLTKRETTDPMVAFENSYLDNKVPLYITIMQVPELNKNDGTDMTKKVDVTSFISNSKNGDIPPKLSFKEVIKEKDAKKVIGNKTAASSGGSRISGSKANSGIGEASQVTKEDTVSFSEAFLTDTISVGKNILMILIFVALVAAGFRHALKGSIDPKEREKTKVTLKNILVGILIFITLSLVVTLVWDYTYKGLDLIKASYEEQIDQEFVNDDEITRGSLILDILEIILKVINEIEAGLIEFTAKTLTGDATLSVTSTAVHEATDSSASTKATGINYISLIYNVYTPDGDVSSMMPFDAAGVEWSRLLSGYNMLMSVAFVVMLFVIVVTACQYVMFAGNTKKITAVKARFIRMFWAALLLITVPYLVQFCLYIFNYLTAAVPINWDDPRFEINIAFDGVLGEIARNLFLTTQCDIYFTFLVRHVMLSVLLVSGPIVIVAWAIYERFRSFPVWFGELFTNIAMQFCYAVGFMVVIFLSYEGQNPVYGLILISTSTGLSKFIKESLQGYFQEGSGINEEGIAQTVRSRAFGWARKTWKGVKKAGNLLEKTSERIDKNQVTKSGVAASNVGKVLQGKFGDITTRRGRMQNMKSKIAKDSLTDIDENEKEKDASGETLEEQKEDAQKNFDEFMNDPNISEDEKADVQEYLDEALQSTNKVIKTGRGYNQANDLAMTTKNYNRDEARKHVNTMLDNYDDIYGSDVNRAFNTARKNIQSNALAKEMNEGDKQLLELGKEALDIKSQVPPQEISQKLETVHESTVQLLSQIAAMDDVTQKEKAINMCEDQIKALAIVDAKANESRMKEDLSMLIAKVSAYKAQKLQNAGINIKQEQMQMLEEAMLAKVYAENSDKDED